MINSAEFYPRAIKMMIPGKHVLNQNAQCLQIVFLTAIPMSVSSNVFASLEQFMRTAPARFKWYKLCLKAIFDENMWHIFQSNCPHGCPCEYYDCENNGSDSSLHFEKIGPFNASLNNKIGEITKYYNNFEFSMELKYGSIQTRRQMLEVIV